jgi:hypothetical protein
MKSISIFLLFCLASLMSGCAGRTQAPPPVDTFTNQPPGMQSYNYMYRSPPPPVASALAGRR